ncbi:MAG: hypothetical protein AB7H96_05810 [Vicinamibacterales bacterium]
MVLTKPELIGLLQNEVRILSHLITKIEPGAVDYRPTEKQRSTIELLRYLCVMGPVLVQSALSGSFEQASWVSRSEAVKEADLATVAGVIAAQADEYASLLGNVSDETFRKEIEMFGAKHTIGSFLVAMVLGGCAAYRTQLFCYLKACGRVELGTMNLWAGIDPAPAQ